VTLEEAIIQVLENAHRAIKPPANWNPLTTAEMRDAVEELLEEKVTIATLIHTMYDLMNQNKIKVRIRSSGLAAWSMV
jgi:hypothetical protein